MTFRQKCRQWARTLIRKARTSLHPAVTWKNALWKGQQGNTEYFTLHYFNEVKFKQRIHRQYRLKKNIHKKFALLKKPKWRCLSIYRDHLHPIKNNPNLRQKSEPESAWIPSLSQLEWMEQAWIPLHLLQPWQACIPLHLLQPWHACIPLPLLQPWQTWIPLHLLQPWQAWGFHAEIQIIFLYREVNCFCNVQYIASNVE